MRVIADAFLMGRIKWDQLPLVHKHNANEIIERVNTLLWHYEKSNPTFITKLNDGIRLNASYGSKTSKHLTAQAIDMDDDQQGSFWNWLKDNLDLLQDIGLWIEHPCWTHLPDGSSWIHFQCVPPKSGRRVFVPNDTPNPNPTFWDGYYDSKLDGLT